MNILLHCKTRGSVDGSVQACKHQVHDTHSADDAFLPSACQRGQCTLGNLPEIEDECPFINTFSLMPRRRVLARISALGSAILDELAFARHLRRSKSAASGRTPHSWSHELVSHHVSARQAPRNFRHNDNVDRAATSQPHHTAGPIRGAGPTFCYVPTDGLRWPRARTSRLRHFRLIRSTIPSSREPIAARNRSRSTT